ncbi:ThiF family adenylyltransferase [Alicyclobacillus sp. SO9]|uniref:ThiF family adenylyltransferase n=1 Tax=Alicyclobacillus sp. SO9 TaxID=2665646 RepID=UPI0018E71B93|nr:ThiF family adenylyltransferase [Alicyclobacillus sp. SO9]QQE80218.1 ThiF family adenylyltransferase [Alicyclobacillus sp. SO9]
MASSLTERYSRQVLFRPIGLLGQENLSRSRVAIVGLGALGTVSAGELARAGVGYLKLIDRDIIEASNLQRQSLYDEEDARKGLAKAAAAADKLRLANSDIEIEVVVTDLTWRNAEELLSDVDVIVDGTDNFEVRYLINEVSVKHSIPWSYGGAVSSYGTTAFFRPDETPCLVCLFGPHQGGGHDTCDTVGVIAPIVATIASLQTAEVLKYLSGNHEALAKVITTIDLWRNDFRQVHLGAKKESCPCCGQHEYPMLTPKADALTVSLCGRRTIQVRSLHAPQETLHQVAQRLQRVGEVRQNPNLLRCDLGEVQITLFADGRALFHGVDDPQTARNLYASYIGN